MEKIQARASGMASDGSAYPVEKLPHIDPSGVRSNDEALARIEKQVSALGGHVVSVFK